MRLEHYKSLENLSLFCHFSGLINIFLGLVVSFIKLIEEGFAGIPMGLFMFAMGYALTKISSKISGIILIEMEDETASADSF